MQTEIESQLLPISLCEMRDPSVSTDQLIREWLFRFGVEHKEDVAPRLPLWLEAFGRMDPEILESLFKRALSTCRFFPKVSEILEPLATAEANASPEAAEKAWVRVLEIRRVDWNPNLRDSKSFNRAFSRLSERVRQASRAAGIFREFTAEEYEKGALHTWARKRFIESFIAWGELEQDKFLLPDGEIKKLLADVAETKALPASDESYEEMRDRGLAYAAQLKSAPRETRQPAPPRLRICAQPTRSFEEQKEILRQKGFLPELQPTEVSV
jgi:hypothetical protein